MVCTSGKLDIFELDTIMDRFHLFIYKYMNYGLQIIEIYYHRNSKSVSCAWDAGDVSGLFCTLFIHTRKKCTELSIMGVFCTLPHISSTCLHNEMYRLIPSNVYVTNEIYLEIISLVLNKKSTILHHRCKSPIVVIF